MKKALWFSRHAPTPEQIEEISAKGFHLCALEEGMALGAVAVEDKDWVGALHELASREKAKAIFGDFSTLILDAILAYRYPVTGSKEAIAILREFQERVKQGIYADWVTASLYAVRSFPRTYPECLWPTHKAWTYVGDL